MVVPRCMLCKTTLNGKTRLEHVLPDAIGGRLASRRLTCSHHNGQLGNGDEKAFAAALVPFRYWLRIHTRRTATPTIRHLETEHGPVDLLPHEDRAVKSTVAFPKIENGRFNVEGRSVEEAATKLAHALRSKGIKTRSAADAALTIENGTNTKTPFRDIGTINGSLGD